MTDEHKVLVERMLELADAKYQHHTIHVPEILRQAAAAIESMSGQLSELEEWRRLALNSAGFAGLKTAEMLRLRKALQDLVDLKDYRDAHGKDEDDYYQTAKPLAWIAAREALAAARKESV